MASEITEEEDADAPGVINTDAQKERIRNIIQRQRSQYLSSSSSFSSAAISCSSSSLSSYKRNANLLQPMKVGSTSLRRLFELEHTSLSAHFNHYCGSPVTKPILLWGSDSDEGAIDPWESIALSFGSPLIENVISEETSYSHSPKPGGLGTQKTEQTRRNMKLERTKSFRRLPKLSRWKWRGFSFRLRLRRLRIMICGRKC